ncbi:MAG: response regulator transcription factor [Thermodesulfobacteriota bacterium]
MEKKTILLIDDHPLFREGLKAIISRDPRYEVVGEAGTGAEGLEMAKELEPDLVVVDLSLPDLSGLELIREVRRGLEATCILVVSMHSRIDYITEAFQAGATGYVVKDSASHMLLQSLETVLAGEYFMDTSVARQVAKRLIDGPAGEPGGAEAGFVLLTPREQEILPLLAEGISTKEIGQRLFISPKTVENHRSNIMNKLGLHSALELFRYAARFGLIDVEKWKK